MLNEEVIDKVIERLVNRIEQGNEYVLKKIGESIKKIGTLSASKAYQLEQILKYGGTYDKIVNQLVKMTGLTVQDILDIFDEVAKKDLNFAKKFYNYRGIDFIPYEENIALKNQVRAIATITASEFANISNTTMLGYGLVDDKGNVTYKGLREAYNELIDEAILSISQGEETFQNAMYRQIKAMGSGGLKVIYPTTYQTRDKVTGEIITKNYTRRLDSVARTQMQQRLREMHNQIQEQIGKEFDYDGIEVTHHANAAPDHIDTVDGKQFAVIDRILYRINNGLEKNIKLEDVRGNQVIVDGKWYDDFEAVNNSLQRQVSTLNCRHTTFSIVLGVSKPEYTQERLDEDKKRNIDGFVLDGKHYSLYEGTQIQRRLEAKIREQKDIQIFGKASGIMENVEEAQKNISILTKKYKELCDISGLPTYLEKARVQGYRRVKIK